MPIDLLNPKDLILENYRHQIAQTIHAYSIPLIVLGEALQNSLDAVGERKTKDGYINIIVDFDNSEVVIQDNGIGFPYKPELLILGGTNKHPSRILKGLVGVGIKVSLFSSERFTIKSRTGTEVWLLEIRDARKFQQDPTLQLEIPNTCPGDSNPRAEQGTDVIIHFPRSDVHEVWIPFMSKQSNLNSPKVAATSNS